MKNVASKLAVIAALGGSLAAYAADPPPASTSAPAESSVVADCKGLAGDAKKECVKVAVQMDQSAQGTDHPAPRPAAPSDKAKGDRSTALGEMHSSPIMITPDEKVAAEAVKKGKDPKVALEKKHEKDMQTAKKNQPATTN